MQVAGGKGKVFPFHRSLCMVSGVSGVIAATEDGDIGVIIRGQSCICDAFRVSYFLSQQR